MTSITVDFGDGTAISYVNISSIDDGVKHIYNKVGIFQVSATARNHLGYDRVFLFLHVSCKSKLSWKFIVNIIAQTVFLYLDSWQCNICPLNIVLDYISNSFHVLKIYFHPNKFLVIYFCFFLIF